MRKVLVIFTVLMVAGLASNAFAKGQKLTKMERAQKTMSKLQAEQECLQTLVSDPKVSKADMAGIVLNYGTCVNFKKKNS